MALPPLLKTLRPHQWVKNLFVLAPLVFSEHALDLTLGLRAAAAFFLFSFLSGSVYILNDLMDIEEDRAHPVKRNRPIPSGALSVPRARSALAILLVGTIIGAFLVGADFAAFGLTYFALNVGYSFSLKHIPFVDAIVIATGFLLRVYGGAAAVDVPISIWLAVCTFLLAMFLALGKRKHELLMAGESAEKQRRVLKRYRLGHVQVAMAVLAVATTASYAAYTFFGDTASAFSPKDLRWTLPMVLIGLGRFHQLTSRGKDGRSPTDLMLKDGIFVGNLVVYAGFVFWTIYFA